jgi:hypothetical protein
MTISKHTDHELYSAWEKIRSGEVISDVSKIASEANIDPKIVSTCLGLIGKVAKSAGFEEFVDFIENNQLPAMKLSTSEMQALKGGNNKDLFKLVRIICHAPGPANGLTDGDCFKTIIPAKKY